MRVATWTWDRSTRLLMNSSNDGSCGSAAWDECCGGVVGGVGGRCVLMLSVGAWPSQRMTWLALCAR